MMVIIQTEVTGMRTQMCFYLHCDICEIEEHLSGLAQCLVCGGMGHLSASGHWLYEDRYTDGSYILPKGADIMCGIISAVF